MVVDLLSDPKVRAVKRHLDIWGGAIKEPLAIAVNGGRSVSSLLDELRQAKLITTHSQRSGDAIGNEISWVTPTKPWLHSSRHERASGEYFLNNVGVYFAALCGPRLLTRVEREMLPPILGEEPPSQVSYLADHETKTLWYGYRVRTHSLATVITQIRTTVGKWQDVPVARVLLELRQLGVLLLSPTPEMCTQLKKVSRRMREEVEVGVALAPQPDNTFALAFRQFVERARKEGRLK